jgi:hypothetical protein
VRRALITRLPSLMGDKRNIGVSHISLQRETSS